MSTSTTDLLTRPVDELAALIRSGDLLSRDLVAASLAQIAARRDLNAFTAVDPAGALAAADAIKPGDPRPFAGVLIAIKDLSAAAGLPLERGSRLFAGQRAAHDNHATRRLRDAGFIIVGKTASPEFGLVPVTEPRANGPTRNPWDPTRTPGGSSGGAAAAVAEGMVPLAHGSDGGGSIRIPAACCGLVGLKPSRGRISAGPEIGDAFLATQGVLARTTRESAQLLDILAGYEPGDATWAAPPPAPFATTAARPPRPLRIAMTTAAPFGATVDPLCARAVHDAAALLTDLGHTVVAATPPEWHSDQLLDAFMALWYTGPLAMVRLGGELAGRAPRPDDLEPLTWAFYERGKGLSAADYLGAIGWLQGYTRRVVPFFADYDLLLTPSLAQRPLPIGYLDTCGDDLEAEFAKALAFTPFTLPWNATGQPAISVPLFHGDDGLPLGVQLVGPPLGDGLLLAVSAQLEEARPWAARRPRTDHPARSH